MTITFKQQGYYLMVIAKKMADTVIQLLEKPYSLGRHDGAGYDCITFLHGFYSELGIDLPKEFEGFTTENYAERWQKGEGRDALLRYLNSLGEEIDISRMLPGDMIVYDGQETAFPAIYLGSQNIILCTEDHGIITMPLGALKKRIIEVRRLWAK